MKFKPFGKLVLIEVLDTRKELEKKTTLYIPENHSSRFWKIKIIELGTDVTLEMKNDDICMANPVPEVDDKKLIGDYKLIHQDHILGRWEK